MNDALCTTMARFVCPYQPDCCEVSCWVETLSYGTCSKQRLVPSAKRASCFAENSDEFQMFIALGLGLKEALSFRLSTFLW
jgi:hypothetical protein